MAKEAKDKTYATRDNHEVLITCMEADFDADEDIENFATRADIRALERTLATLQDGFSQFRDAFMSKQDRILKDLEKLITEKAGRDAHTS
ncbi:hypothetical protein ACFL6S_37725 [Candidatus Poribacteria bacterium]